MSLVQYFKRSARYILRGIPTKYVSAEIVYLTPNERLKGKRIIVTGGGRGLGAAMSAKFVSEGAIVLIAGRDTNMLQKTANSIGCMYLPLDLKVPSSFNRFIDEADEMLGGADCLVNNAGISLHEPSFFEVTENSFDLQVDTNFKGTYFLTQSFIKKALTNKRKGNVLFISSETGSTADNRPYGYTKAAINSMTQGLAKLFIKDGIRINALSPGVTASDMTGFDTKGNLYYSGNEIERIYFPEEVAEIACFLISEASGCISGQILLCNNGNTINTRWK